MTPPLHHQALIWDIQQMPRAIEDPILAYTAAEGEINQIQVDTARLSCSWPAPAPALAQPSPFPLPLDTFFQWGATQPDWIAICYNKNLEILRV